MKNLIAALKFTRAVFMAPIAGGAGPLGFCDDRTRRAGPGTNPKAHAG